MNYDLEVDWLVAGSGAGGMTGGIVAHELGADVLMVEAASQYGGTTSFSGGVIWVPGNHLQHTVGIDDSIEEGYEYLRSLIGDSVKEERYRAYAERADEMLQFMMKHSEVSYRPIPNYMDYFEEHPGYKRGGRSMCPGAFRKSKLGDEAGRLRTGPYEGMGMPFSMTVLESRTLMAMSWKSYLLGVWMLLRYWLDIPARLRGRDDDRLAVGEGLIAKLRYSMMQRDIPLWLNSPVAELIQENGRVVGAVVEREGKRVAVAARKGVLMATGGFGKNNQMRQKYHFKPISSDWSAASPDSQGSGIEIGQAVGAAIDFMHSVWWTPSYSLPDGRTIALIAGKSQPGTLMVNKQGKRFTNEAQPYEELVKDQYASHQRGEGAIPCYLVFDRLARSKYAIGHIKPAKIEGDDAIPESYYESGLLAKADTLEELAQKLDIDADAFVDTVSRFNEHAARGEDPEFHRGESLHDKYYGDWRQKPNPSLATLETAPYYAMRLEPGDLDTKGGLLADEHGQVCNEANEPIPGLYATGNTSAAVMGDTYPGAGATIGSSMTFAYIAARHAVESG